jgi:hypothetical protein
MYYYVPVVGLTYPYPTFDALPTPYLPCSSFRRLPRVSRPFQSSHSNLSQRAFTAEPRRQQRLDRAARLRPKIFLFGEGGLCSILVSPQFPINRISYIIFFYAFALSPSTPFNPKQHNLYFPSVHHSPTSRSSSGFSTTLIGFGHHSHFLADSLPSFLFTSLGRWF